MKSDLSNITWHLGKVSRKDREALLNQCGCVVWLTGLSSSGKSSIAHELEKRLISEGYLVYVLDGDSIRHGLNQDLGFSPGDRRENIRRIGAIAALFSDAGLITITAFISPYKADRNNVRKKLGRNRFIEVHLDVPLDVCEKRDPKNLYKKALNEEIPDFTGISASYEIPKKPEIILDTSEKSVSDCVEIIVRYLNSLSILSKQSR